MGEQHGADTGTTREKTRGQGTRNDDDDNNDDNNDNNNDNNNNNRHTVDRISLVGVAQGATKKYIKGKMFTLKYILHFLLFGPLQERETVLTTIENKLIISKPRNDHLLLEIFPRLDTSHKSQRKKLHITKTTRERKMKTTKLASQSCNGM